LLPDVSDDIWIKVVEKKILSNPDKKYVITDVRFNNEFEFINKYNGITIKVERDKIHNNDCHISETFFNNLYTDYAIKNNGTLEELYEKINAIIFHNK